MIFSSKNKILSTLLSLTIISTMAAGVPFTASAVNAADIGVSYQVYGQSYFDDTLSYSDFAANLTVSPGATWKLYKPDITAEDPTITSGDKLYVTSLDTNTIGVYTLILVSSDTIISKITVKNVIATKDADNLATYNISLPKGTDLTKIKAADFNVTLQLTHHIKVDTPYKVSDNKWQIEVDSDTEHYFYDINLSVAP